MVIDEWTDGDTQDRDRNRRIPRLTASDYEVEAFGLVVCRAAEREHVQIEERLRIHRSGYRRGYNH